MNIFYFKAENSFFNERRNQFLLLCIVVVTLVLNDKIYLVSGKEVVEDPYLSLFHYSNVLMRIA